LFFEQDFYMAAHNFLVAPETTKLLSPDTGLFTTTKDLKEAEFLVDLLTALVGSLAMGKQVIDALMYNEELQAVDGIHIARPAARAFADDLMSDDGSDAADDVQDDTADAMHDDSIDVAVLAATASATEDGTDPAEVPATEQAQGSADSPEIITLAGDASIETGADISIYATTADVVIEPGHDSEEDSVNEDVQ
jgi:hypothetical protein